MTHSSESAKPLRVMIVEDDTFVGLGLRADLERLGHFVVGQAADEQEATRLVEAENPDLILMDVRLRSDDGVELARQLMTDRPTPVIIISAYSEAALIERAAEAGVFGYLIKPVTREALAAQIAVAMQRFAEQSKLRDEKNDALTALETRKLLDRAKASLIKTLGLSEAEAHKMLQTESQKRRISLAELAKRIIETDQTLSR